MNYMKTALSGINSANKAISNASNNIANSETVGFKATSMTFGQMVVKDGNGGTGIGVDGGSVSTNFNGGSMVPTGNPLNQAISGDGFFIVEGSNGEKSLTRSGIFDFNKEGNLVDPNGNFVQGFERGSSELSNITLSDQPLPPVVTDSGKISVNFGSDMTDPTDKVSTSVKVMDSLGQEHTANVTFSDYKLDPVTNEATWTITADVDGVAVPLAPNDKIVFDKSGKPILGNGALDADGKLKLDLSTLTPSLPGVGTVELDMTKSTGYAGDTVIKSQTSNGRTYSEYNNYTVESDGKIVFNYDGGETREISQIALATVQDLNGLMTESSGYYSMGADSGEVTYGVSGQGSFGNVQSGYLEGSNVDMTGQLVALISLQNAFQSNSKVLGVAKELNQSLMAAI